MFVWMMLIVSALVTTWVIFNSMQWPKPLLSKQPIDELAASTYPFVSILVPARNEERVIERCLVSLLEQDYPQFEVICLDDRSEDRTANILEELQQRFPHLKWLSGQPLPDNWIGKCHACYQLSQEARGEYLLFTDADTFHSPTMLKTMVRTVVKKRADFLTGFPRVETKHLLGWLILPLLFFVIVLHLPLRQVSRSQDPRFIAAHGAFLLFKREAYFAIGGHEMHKYAIVEDMEMAKAIKKTKRQAVLIDITSHVACDMYEHPRDVWHGFSKNMFIGLGASTPLLLVLLTCYSIVYVLPIIFAILHFAVGSLTVGLLWMCSYLLSCIQKYIVDRKFGTKGFWFLCLPASFVVMSCIAVRSWYLYISKKGYTWKGRVYTR